MMMTVFKIPDVALNYLCRFLIHRYLNDFLKTKIESKDFSCDLLRGSATVRKVEIDSRSLNESLASRVPLTVVDGFIKEIHASIPWQSPLKGSCEIKIQGLEMTLRPKSTLLESDQADLVTSMIGSMVGSMATSTQIAEDFVRENKEKAADNGADRFAEIVDVLASQFRMTFEQTVIRIETEPEPGTSLCTAIEIQLDRCELIDRQMDQKTKSEFSSQEVTSNMEIPVQMPVTEQPRPTKGMTDIDKVVHMKGIRLYTDVFSKPDGPNSMANDESIISTQSTANVFSGRIERSPEGFSIPSTASHLFEVPVDQSNYQSCYSDAQTSTLYNSVSGSHACSPVNVKAECSIRLKSNPIQFAEFTGKKQCVYVHIHEGDQKDTKQEIRFEFDGLFIFATPTQIHLINNILRKMMDPGADSNFGYCGRPIPPEERAVLEVEALPKFMGVRSDHCRYSTSNSAFCGVNSKQFSILFEDNMADIPLHEGSETPEFCHENKKTSVPECNGRVIRNAFTKKTSIGFSTKAFLMIIPHIDCLDGIKNWSRTMVNYKPTPEAFEIFGKKAELFFEKAQSFALGCDIDLQGYREVFDKFFLEDHLRLSGIGVLFEYSLTKILDELLLEMNFSAAKFEFIEVLAPSSIKGHDGSGFTYVDLISFSEVGESSGKGTYSNSFSLAYSKKNRESIIKMDLSPCCTEVDMSIVDRISPLLELFCEKMSPMNSELNPISSPTYTSTSFAEAQTVVLFTLNCPIWKVRLRFPKAVLSSTDRLPYWMRDLQSETLCFVIYGASVEIPASEVSQLCQHGNLTLSATKLYGSFFGEDSCLQCSEEEMEFLYAGSETGGSKGAVKICVKYNLCDSSLDRDDLNNGLEERSEYSSFMQPGEQMEGPFSVEVKLYETEKVIRVGNREELFKFSETCASHSHLSVDFFADHLRLHLPSRQFYEVLYNRLANDFCLWECNSPLLKKSSISHASTDSDDIEDNVLNSVPKGFEEVKSKNQKLGMRSNFVKEKLHSSSLRLRANGCKVVVSVKMKKEEAPVAASQICFDMTNMQLFTVVGYHATEGVNYFYMTSGTIKLFNHNFVDVVDIKTEKFAEYGKGDVYIAPTSEEDHSNLLVDDNNVAVAVHVDYIKKKNIKNILFALGLNNSTLYASQLSNFNDFWVGQLIYFFNVEDYVISGYKVPEINMEVHAHLGSTTLDYTHPDENTDSKTHVRFIVGSSDISCDIVPDMNVYRFGCILEDSKLLLFVSKDSPSHVNFEKSDSRRMRRNFVELASVDNFQLEVSAGGALFSESCSFLEGFLLELNCKHGLIKIHACADSLMRLINLALSLTATKNIDTSFTLSHCENPYSSELPDNLLKPLSADTPSNVFVAVLEEELKNDDEVTEAPFYKGFGERTRCSSGTSDEEFCIVDALPGSGVLEPLNSDGHPRVRFFEKEDECSFDVDVEYIRIPSKRDIMMLPRNHTNPVIKYSIQDFSLELHLYGGNDFGLGWGKQKVYSDESFRDGKGSGQRVYPSEKGGPYRDHSVQVFFKLSKINYEYSLFDGGSVLCYHWFTIKNIEVYDKLRTSKIDKMMYQYSSSEVPKREFAPMFAVRLVENYKYEGKLRVSVLPIRLNLELDTLLFLSDFINEASSLLLISNGEVGGLDIPKIEASQECNNRLYPKLCCSSPFSSSRPQYPLERKTSNNPIPLQLLASDRLIHEGEGNDNERDAVDPKLCESLKHFFDERNNVGTFCSSKTEVMKSRFGYDPKDQETQEESEFAAEFAKDLGLDENECFAEHSPDTATQLEYSHAKLNCSNPSKGQGLYFKEFTFSPPVLIRLDFHGRRIIMDQGAVIGFLSAASNLHCTQLILNDLHNVDGMLGLKRCINYAIQEWTNDIANNQVTQIIGSYAPISSFVQLAKGVRDLLFMPVDEYRKEDGHVIRGLQKGAQSFGFSTAAAAVDIAQKVVGMIQGFAEVAFDIVSPDMPSFERRRKQFLQAEQGHPSDLKQGFHMAYETVKEGVGDAAYVLQRAAEEKKRLGPLRCFLKQLTPTFLRPVVIGAKATNHVLDGLKSQLSPDVYREELEKWKKENLAHSTDNCL